MKIRYLFDYLNERFPPINMALFVVLYVTVYSTATALTDTRLFDFPLHVLGAVSVISFFFRLRVMDEIKDYSIDQINHPERILQSGKIDLQSLIYLAFLGFVLEGIWSVLLGFQTLVVWGVAVGYSFLMRYEFFMPRFLKKRLLLYALTHMLIMPIIIAWVYVAFVGEVRTTEPLILLAALSMLAGFSFEIARKIHDKEAERKSVDSYSKSIGYKTAVILVLVLVSLGVGTQFYLLLALQATLISYVVISALLVLIIGYYIQLLIRPHEGRLRKAEKLVSLFMLISYLSIILEVHL